MTTADRHNRYGLLRFIELQIDERIGTATVATFPRVFVYGCLGALALLLLWAAVAPIDQVVRAGGRIVPTGDPQVVQHLEGGIVSEIFVREGQKVAAGAPLVRISDTRFAAERAESLIKLEALRAKAARLAAEARGASMTATGADSAVASERAAFAARRLKLTQSIEIVQAQAAQKRAELSELNSQIAGLQDELKLASQELAIVNDMMAKRAASRLEQINAQSKKQQIENDLARARLSVPRVTAAIRELEAKAGELIADSRGDASLQLAETNTEIARLTEYVETGNDRTARTVIRAPRAARVNRVFVSTIGGVVKPGEQIMELTPDDGDITVEGRLAPSDRARIRIGLPAIVKVGAYDFTVYGTLKGVVQEISADSIADERGDRYFRVRIRIPDSSRREFGHELVPGMNAAVDLIVGQRTLLQSMLQPIRQVQDGAFKDGL